MGKLLQEIRINCAIAINDPFPEMPGKLENIILGSSKKHIYYFSYHEKHCCGQIKQDWRPKNNRSLVENEEIKRKEARNRAVVLEMIGDLPSAEIKPASNTLFVCKINPITTEEDLLLIFGQCGDIIDCAIIRDSKTGESMNYGFISYESENACERAYFKMNNVIVDERRIKVDFSQSVSRVSTKY